MLDAAALPLFVADLAQVYIHLNGVTSRPEAVRCFADLEQVVDWMLAFKREMLGAQPDREQVSRMTRLQIPAHSNKIYQQIGYQPVCDVHQYEFSQE